MEKEDHTQQRKKESWEGTLKSRVPPKIYDDEYNMLEYLGIQST